MIAIVLEMSGAPALAFAVGLYLPISTSAPIFVGGLVRYFVDLYLKRKLASRNLTEDQIVAETDKSNGVLLASGYIAGGAIAGILVAVFAVIKFSQGRAQSLSDYLGAGLTVDKDGEGIANIFIGWAKVHNPFFDGPNADWLGILPFWILALILYYVGRELLLTGKKSN